MHETVLTLPWEQAGLLIAYAKKDAEPEIPRPIRLIAVPVFEEKGWRNRIRSAYDFQLKCSRQWCPAVPSGDERAIAAATERRQVWFDAREELWIRLEDVSLEAHEVIGGSGPEIRIGDPKKSASVINITFANRARA